MQENMRNQNHYGLIHIVYFILSAYSGLPHMPSPQLIKEDGLQGVYHRKNNNDNTNQSLTIKLGKGASHEVSFFFGLIFTNK